ncbi:aminodeoxychorismate synthase component I [Sphingomonas lenta]|uniref:Probable branched-chain-amino-acid aminotransferase n=1 Tax=Sphingomonas lenta TaxID=1141887 RepID=A0A2A2SE71_9SPHN|nr:aminodeoxychorismate synthase component I [Sphingomonas lenta]PAX07557.1 aminodeoxychorismate synthase, component I [Sphingomonas lenta]
MRPQAPFVLLDDARPGGAPARLYRDPVRVVEAREPAEVRPALDTLRAARAQGLHAAGFLAYEAGAAFEPAAPAGAPDGPLLWFGLFERWEEGPSAMPDPAGAWIGALAPCVDHATYAEAFAQVAELIRAGDLYQANLSFRARAPVQGDPLALYAALRARAGAGWGAVVATGDATYLSFSPELFFRLEGGRLTCRPMKGTARRVAAPAQDRAAAQALAADPKQRAENLMIVDLMRNDLSRVAVAGSVAVPELFTVESYPTVHQMVSAVTAELAPDRDALDVIAAAFPCGSITGAPKVGAMQVLAKVERGPPRGLYTGSIGHLDAGGDAQFNVAIRTLTIRDGEAVLGLGSGLVADSDVDEEWDECLAKAAFLQAGERRFDLIETMAFDPEEGIVLLDHHMARLKASAVAFGFKLDRHAARNELQAATFRLRSPARVRLLLSRNGAVATETGPMPPAPPGPAEVAIVPLPVSPRDFRLRHKTTDRAFYDRARRDAGTWEVLFEDGEGRLTEGSFTSLFVPRDGRLVTPPLARGLLPGVLRASLLADGRAEEGELTRADLADGFLLGNALRGLIPARLAVARVEAAG